MTQRALTRSTLTLLVALVLLAAGAPATLADTTPAAQDEMQHEEHHATETDEGSDDMPMDEMHARMMERHQKMVAEVKQQKAELDALVDAMDSAEGDAKVDAMAAVLSELVSQHQARMGQRIEMMETMREGGLMKHGGMHHGAEAKGHHRSCDCKKKGHAHAHGGECPHHGDSQKCPKCAHHAKGDDAKCDCPMHEGHEMKEKKGMEKEMQGEGADAASSTAG